MQMHIWKHATACYRPDQLLIDAPVSCVCCCVDAPLVSSCLAARVDSAGKLACELCGRRFIGGKAHRPHGAGRAHVTCILERKRPSSVTTAATAPTAPIAAQSPKRSHKRRADSDPGKQGHKQATPAEATKQSEDTSWDQHRQNSQHGSRVLN